MTVAIKERPILFSGPMVRALLDGRKTQTRRLFKLPRGMSWYADLGGEAKGWYGDDDGLGWWHVEECSCPYGSVGDRLWVRETFYIDDIDHLTGRLPKERPGELDDSQFYYAADGTCCQQIPECQCASVGKPKWRPSIFMPRWASRITLEVTAVLVQRLQDITEDDAIAEGSQCAGFPAALTNRSAFGKLWEQINGKGSWVENPWVWAITFKRVPNANL